MRIEDRLNKKTREQLNKIRRRKRKKKLPININPLHSKENFSERDIKELMGQYEPTYKRGKGGAIRRK